MYLILTSLIYLRDVQRKKVAGIVNYESVHRDRVPRAKTNTAQQETTNTKHEHEVFGTTVFFYLHISFFLQMPNCRHGTVNCLA